MAWVYSDYPSKATDTERLDTARLFYSEIINAIQANVSADGKSRDSSSLNELLAMVRKDIADLESKTGRGVSPQVMYPDFRRGP